MTVLDPGIERGACITGVGMSPIGRRTGIAGTDLTAAAARAAIADAGLRPADIDGIASMGDTPVGEAARAVGIDAAWSGGGFDTGGLLSPLMSAFVAVGSGQARHVLVYRTVQMMGGSILPQEPGERSAPRGPDWIGPLMTMHAYSAVNWLAMHCRRHMHLYGTTKEQLGWLAVNSRRNAALNPAAVYKEPITLGDYLAARSISDPLSLLDCDVPVDGSIAVVVSAADRAGDGPNPPVRVEAIGGSRGE
ncbi:MAG TPA: thiolase family protein, partial [Trebonia sp.]